MTDTKVTYLIGAGASANALPVVNGMKERMRIFYYYLCHSNESVREMGPSFPKLENIENLLIEIEKAYTIDTYARMIFLREDYYNFLKEFTAAYFLFEQSEKDEILLKESIDRFFSYKESIGKKIKEREKTFNYLFEAINTRYDYRYDSLFATLLQKDQAHLKLPYNINIISWNYDNQFEISYSNFLRSTISKGLARSQQLLNVYPAQKENLESGKSKIIKINGSADYDYNIEERFHDPVNDKFEKNAVTKFRELNNNLYKKRTNIKFAWEDDEQVREAREYAQEIITDSDIIVVIGYSFPTFNREVDRFIFKEFDETCIRYSIFQNQTIEKKERKFEKLKKIYIQDTAENAPKIKERLKAIGNNLYDIAEPYTDLDQFLIPLEL